MSDVESMACVTVQAQKDSKQRLYGKLHCCYGPADRLHVLLLTVIVQSWCTLLICLTAGRIKAPLLQSRDCYLYVQCFAKRLFLNLCSIIK